MSSPGRDRNSPVTGSPISRAWSCQRRPTLFAKLSKGAGLTAKRAASVFLIRGLWATRKPLSWRSERGIPPLSALAGLSSDILTADFAAGRVAQRARHRNSGKYAVMPILHSGGKMCTRTNRSGRLASSAAGRGRNIHSSVSVPARVVLSKTYL